MRIDEAMGKAEVTNALQMLSELPERAGRRTIGGDKGFDTREVVEWTRAMNVTPHVAQNEYPGRSSAVDDGTIRRAGYTISQRIRKRVEGSSGGRGRSQTSEGAATRARHERSSQRSSWVRPTTCSECRAYWSGRRDSQARPPDTADAPSATNDRPDHRIAGISPAPNPILPDPVRTLIAVARPPSRPRHLRCAVCSGRRQLLGTMSRGWQPWPDAFRT